MWQRTKSGLLLACLLLTRSTAQDPNSVQAVPAPQQAVAQQTVPQQATTEPATVVDDAGIFGLATPTVDESSSASASNSSASPPAGTLPATPVPRVLAGVAADTDVNNLASPNMVGWLKQLVRDNLPESYEDTRKWDKQKEVWDGLDVSLDGLKVKTKRKHKMVNHGTWTRYRLQMVDPAKHLEIQFHKLQVDAEGKVIFDVSVEMLLDVFGRLSQWVRDVQIISLSANADAVCKMTVQGNVEFQLNPLRFPPDIRIKPHVDAARVDISYFRVRRISQIGGEFAEQLGKGLRTAVESKLEDSNEKLPAKINKQLDKHSDRMLFSTQDWLQSKLPLPAK